MAIETTDYNTAVERMEAAEKAAHGARSALDAIAKLGLEDEDYFAAALEELISKADDLEEAYGELVDADNQAMIDNQNREYMESVL